MVVCHCCLGGSGDSGVGYRQHQQEQGSASVILYWDSGEKVWRGESLWISCPSTLKL
jgi:hypothetical protein